jgi:hypothetical protein
LEQEEQNFELFWREADNQQVILMAEGNLPSAQNGRVSDAAACAEVAEPGKSPLPEVLDDHEANDQVEAFPVFTH